MIRTVAEHSFEETFLPKSAIIMDAGCADFEFTNFLRERGHNVLPIDIRDFERTAWRCAITGHNGRVGIQYSDDQQATKIKDGDEIPCYTIQEFARINDIEMFDLIKLDIEGSEYEAIMAMNKPMAKQLSIEFHLHTGIYQMDDMEVIEHHLKKLGYLFIQHELTDRHCAGLNYWDSLFILP